jgi:AsmA protein
MLKSAVIRLTPDSEANEPDAPIAPADSGDGAASDATNGWTFDIGHLSIADSLLIWQRAKSDQINVRDINLQMDQNSQRQATVKLSSRINRDQRDLTLNVDATLDVRNYPRQYAANISNMTYTLTGADIPAKGISGQVSLQAQYQQMTNTMTLDKLALTANDNQFTGSGQAVLSDVPDYQLSLQADKLNLDEISGWQPSSNSSEQPPTQAVMAAPVIARDIAQQPNSLSVLNGFNAQLALKALALTYRGLAIKNLDLQATNHLGDVQLSTLSGNMGEGTFSLPGTLNSTQQQLQMSFSPELKNIQLGDLLTAYNLPKALTGSFSMQGKLTGNGLTLEDFNSNWQGDAQMSMSDAHLNGLNIQQLVQQAVVRSSNRVQGMQRYDLYSQIQQMQAHGRLRDGQLSLENLNAESPMMNVQGQGKVNFAQQQADMKLLVRVTGGWQGDNPLITTLQKTDIPLRVFGPWKQLNYELNADQVLRQQLQQDARSAIQDWIDKRQNSRPAEKTN